MDLSVVVILWIVSACVCWFIADSRDAPDPLTWAVIGVVFGPLGILLALVAAKPKAQAE
jgi:hypothetical protein